MSLVQKPTNFLVKFAIRYWANPFALPLGPVVDLVDPRVGLRAKPKPNLAELDSKKRNRLMVTFPAGEDKRFLDTNL